MTTNLAPIAADPTTPCPDCPSTDYLVLHGPSTAGEYEVGCTECGVTYYVSAGEVEDLPSPLGTIPAGADGPADMPEDWVLNLRSGW